MEVEVPEPYFYRISSRTASKDIECDFCKRIIEKGLKYRRWFTVPYKGAKGQMQVGHFYMNCVDEENE